MKTYTKEFKVQVVFDNPPSSSPSSPQARPLAQSQEGAADPGPDGGEDRLAAAHRGVQPDDRVLRLLRELPGVHGDAAVSSLQRLGARQPRRVWKLWRERVPVPQVQVSLRCSPRRVPGEH